MSQKYLWPTNSVMPFQFEGLPIRGRICRLGPALNKIIRQHDYPIGISKLLGEALTLTVLMADSIKLKHKLSIQIHGKGDLKLIATDYRISPDRSDPPRIRGYAKFNRSMDDNLDSVQDMMGEGYFATILDQGYGSVPYKGISNLDKKGLAHSAQEFFLNSEQLETRFWVNIYEGCDHEGNTFLNGIGLMLQRLPNIEEMNTSAGVGKRGIGLNEEISTNKILSLSNWEKIVSLLNKAGQEVMSYQAGYFSDILVKVFLDEDLRIFEEKEFDFGCGCSSDKVVQTMSIYSKNELRTMTNKRGKVTADCQFCGLHYEFNPSELGHKS